MTSRKTLLYAALLCSAFVASSAFARSWFDTEVRSDQASRVQQYQLQNVEAVKDNDAVVVSDPTATAGGFVPRHSLGSVASIAASPGVMVDNSYDDWQYTYPGHHVDWRGRPYIQFSYVDRQAGAAGTNKFGYNAYQPIGGSWPRGQGSGCEIQLGEDVGQYPNLDVRSNGRVVMGGHQTLMTGAFPLDNVTYYQGTTPFTCVFSISVIDSSQYKTGMIQFQKDSSRLYQILIELQEWGNDTITHLIGQQGAHTHLAAPGKTNCTVFPIQYFRKMTFSGAASWVGPQTLDTVQRMAALTSSRVSPKVAVVYIKYTPEGITNNNSNDQTIMYRESDSVGVSWKPKVDITPYGRMDSVTYSPWVDARALYDTNGKLHIVWNARPIPINPYGTNFAGWNVLTIGASIFHWSNATGAISRVHNAEWDGLADAYPADFCGFIGTNMLNTGAESISECNGHLYVTWVMGNDMNANPPLLNDCISGSGNLLDARFKANGEIYMSVSSDLSGLLWDKYRNLTNSPTPGCDSAGFGGVCMNDVKPSMSRYGMNITAFDTNAIPVTLTWPDTGVNPGPGPYTGNYYTHLFYVEDHWPGNKGIENAGNTPQGNWVLNPLKWMRLACVAPVSAPQIDFAPKTLGYANKDWTKHGKPDTTIVTVRNDGNATLNVTTIGMAKTTLPGTDWLGVTAASLTVSAGIGNTQTFGVIVNKGGVINTPGTIVALTGEVYLKSNVAAPRDSMSVKITNFLVADTLVGLKWDTVTTGCTRLVVSNNGDVGRLGATTVNMDYVALGGECVTTASTYAYDGGPVVIRKSGANYIYSNALFQGDFTTEQAFKPVNIGAGAATVAGPGYDGFFTGTFVNKDTTIGVRRTYYAPTAGIDSCNFVVQESKFFGIGGPKTGVTLGEVVDWDIPTYTGSNNDGRVLTSKNIVYQQGLDTSTTRCQKHNRRFGSIVFLGQWTAAEKAGDPTFYDANMYGAYAMLNDTLFKYDSLSNSLEGAYFWNQMGALSGLTAAPSQAKDLHSVLTYKHNVTLDTLSVFTALLSVKDGDTTTLKAGVDKARKWFLNHLCPGCPQGNCCTALSIDGRTGNVDGDPAKGVDISDLSALIDFLYISFTPPPCLLSANTDGDGGGGVDISDLSALIDFLYISFTPCALCPN